MVRNLSETVVLPIAGMILTFVLCYELIQLIIEKNNLQDFDTFNIFKWIFKTFIAVYILTNTFNIDSTAKTQFPRPMIFENFTPRLLLWDISR
jgi:hypothetical protein